MCILNVRFSQVISSFLVRLNIKNPKEKGFISLYNCCTNSGHNKTRVKCDISNDIMLMVSLWFARIVL